MDNHYFIVIIATNTIRACVRLRMHENQTNVYFIFLFVYPSSSIRSTKASFFPAFSSYIIEYSPWLCCGHCIIHRFNCIANANESHHPPNIYKHGGHGETAKQRNRFAFVFSSFSRRSTCIQNIDVSRVAANPNHSSSFR